MIVIKNMNKPERCLSCPFVDSNDECILQDDDKNRLPFAFLLPFLGTHLLLLNLDVVFLCQPSQSLWVSHLQMFHDKAHRSATLAAGEAMTVVSCWRDGEGRCAVVMERAQALIVRTSFL